MKNMKRIVTYSSAYGSAAKYAELLSGKLSLPVSEISQCSISDYDQAIHFGSIYAGAILGLEQALRSSPSLILVTVGIADPSIKENAEHIDQRVLKDAGDQKGKIVRIFHLRGNLDYSRLSFRHRAMMWMLCRMLRRKKNKTLEDQYVIDTYGKRIDFFSEDSLNKIAEYIMESLM